MAVSFDEFISKWKSFEDFEKKRESTWTVDIDLSKFEKMQKAFETMEASARKTFGKSGIFQFDDAEKATTYIRKLDDNIAKLEQRYEQLKQTAELFSKASAEKGGDKELSDKANAANEYAQSLQRVIDVYRSSKSAVTRSKGGSGYDLDESFMNDERIKQIAERTKELDKRAEEYNKALERVGVVKAPQQEQNQEQNQEKSSEKTIEQLKAEAEARKKQYQEWDANKKAQQKEESPDATIIKNVEWIGESIADSTPVVQELASQIKSVGVEATATSVAMQQIGESGEDALTRVANLTATVQEGLQYLNSQDAFSGYLDMALEDAQTQEGIDAISRLIEIAKNYKAVLDMLIIAQEKAQATRIEEPQKSSDSTGEKNPNTVTLDNEIDVETLPDALDPTPVEKFNDMMDKLVQKLYIIGDMITEQVQNKFESACGSIGSGFLETMDGVAKGIISTSDKVTAFFSNGAEKFSAKIAERKASKKAKKQEESPEPIQEEIDKKSQLIEKNQELAQSYTNSDKATTKGFGDAYANQGVKSIEDLEMRINRLKGDIEEFKESAKSGNGELTLSEYAESIQKAQAELRKLESIQKVIGVNETKSPVSEQQASGFERIKNAVSSMQAVFSTVKGVLGSVTGALSKVGSVASSVAGAVFNLAKQGFGALVNVASKIGSVLGSVVSTGFNAMKSSISGVIGAFNSLNSGARTVITTLGSLAQKGFGAVKTGIQSAVKGVGGLVGRFRDLGGRTSKNLLKSLTSIKSMLKRRVKRTFISGIFNQAKEGMQQLAKFDAGFNSAMSNIKNSSKQAAGNLAVTMGNIVQMIAPAIEWLLNLLSSVFEKINAVFALLGGKSTVKTAKKGTDDYAKSLKSAGGAAKDLNKQLYGFDEITRQEDNSGGGGGKIGYEDKNVADILDERLKAIMDAIQSGQWEKAGELVGKALNDVVKVVDEKLIEFRPIAKKWAKNIAEFGNGFVKGVDWKLIGKTIGDGLNLVLDTLNTFLTTFDFKALGDAFATGVNSIFDTVEWDLLGETLANGYNAIWRTMYGFVSKAEWAKYGKSFAKAVNSFFESIDFESISGTISGGINGIVDTFLNFVENIEWDKISKKIAYYLKRTIKNIKWGNIGTAFATGFNKLLIVAENILQEDIISTFGEKIGTMLGTALGKIDWKKLGKVASNGLSEIQKAFTKFIKKLNLPQLGKNIAEGIQSAFDNIDWDARKEAITTGINSVVSGLSNAINGVKWSEFAKELAENTNSIIDGIKWDEIGKLLADGANQAFGAISTFVNEFDWKNLGTKVTTGIQTFASNINWANVRLTISGMINGLTALFTELTKVDWVQIAKDITTELDTLVSGGEGGINWSSIEELLTTSINTLIDIFGTLVTSDTIVNLATNLGKTINGVLVDIKWDELGKNARDGLGKIVRAFKNLVTRIDLPSIAKKLGEGVRSFFNADENGKTAFDYVADAVMTGIQTIVEAFGNLVDEVFKTEWVDGKQVNIGTKLADAFNSMFADNGTEQSLFHKIGVTIGTALKNIVQNITAFINEADFGAMAQGLLDMISTAVNGVFQKDGAFDATTARQVGQSISQGLGDVLTNITQFLEDVDFEAIGESIGGFLGEINWIDLAVKLLKLLWQGLIGGLKLVGGLAGEFFRRLFGVPDDVNFDASATEWANQFSQSTEEALESGTVQQRIAKAAAMISSGLNNELINSAEGNDEVARGFANRTVNGIVGALDNAQSEIRKWKGVTFDFSSIADYTDEQMADAFRYCDFSSATDMLTQNFQISAGDAMPILYDILRTASKNNLDADTLFSGIYENSESKDKLLAYFEQLGIEVPDKLINSLVGAIPAVNHTARVLLDNINVADKWEEVKQAFADAGIVVTDEFAKSLTGVGAENVATALMLFGEGLDQETISALDNSKLSENIDAFMLKNGASIQETIGALMLASGHSLEEVSAMLGKDAGYLLAMTLPEGMVVGIKEGEQTVQEASDEFKAMAIMSDEDAQEAKTSSENVGSETTAGVEGELNKTEGVSTASENIKKTIDDKIAELPEEEQENAKAMMDMMVQGILEGDPLVQTAIENSATAVVDKVKGILAGSEGKKIVNTFLSGMKTAINSNFDLTVKNPLATLSGQAINAIVARINYDNGYTITYQLLQGMYDGIGNGNGQAVVDIFTQVVQALIDTAKAILGIHSPSRVFNEIGAYTMQGMEDGLLSSGDNAVNTVANIVDQMINEGSGVELDASFSAVSSGLDVATDKLSRIADIFSGIADTLVQMGGLQVPTIATGQTIPYRTQLEAMPTASQTAMSDPHALEDAIYSAFTRAIGNTEDDRQVNITLQIDGRKMADIVSKYQRQQSRAWGV